jgi:hypothetical protein
VFDLIFSHSGPFCKWKERQRRAFAVASTPFGEMRHRVFSHNVSVAIMFDRYKLKEDVVECDMGRNAGKQA